MFTAILDCRETCRLGLQRHSTQTICHSPRRSRTGISQFL